MDNFEHVTWSGLILKQSGFMRYVDNTFSIFVPMEWINLMSSCFLTACILTNSTMGMEKGEALPSLDVLIYCTNDFVRTKGLLQANPHGPFLKCLQSPSSPSKVGSPFHTG